MDDIKRKYFLEIKRLLPCDVKEKKRCIKELEYDVDEFLENSPSATFEAMCKALGSPQEVARSFLESTDPERLSCKVSAKRRIAIGVVAVVAMLAVALGLMAFIFADDLHDYRGGYAVETYERNSSENVPMPSPLTIN